MSTWKIIVNILWVIGSCSSGFPPKPEGVIVIQSQHYKDTSISYKQNSLCETTPGVRSFAGYVNLPPYILAPLGIKNQSWPIHTFWWFFEAKKDPLNSPLLIWINGTYIETIEACALSARVFSVAIVVGASAFPLFQIHANVNTPRFVGGPGASSSGNPLGYNGPCKVRPDGNSTHLVKWSWNRDVNLLYVDQPVQVGLSYDTFQNISYNLVNGNITLLPPFNTYSNASSLGSTAPVDSPLYITANSSAANSNSLIPDPNTTLLIGTYASTDTHRTSLGSVDGAYALWHFAQVFFQDFPEHKPIDKRISISGVSYGGKYAPAIAAFFEEQNERIADGTYHVPGERDIILDFDTLMIESGCIDLAHSWFSYPEMAVNNTYGIKAVNDTTLDLMLHNLHKPGGCLDQAYKCGNLSLQYDPKAIGVNETVNNICNNAGHYCDRKVQNLFDRSHRSVYDITVPADLSRAPPFSKAFFQQPHVLQALGAGHPGVSGLNWTSGASWVSEANRREGDFARPGWPDKMAYLLERGKKVAFVYGDKDYICNWFGGEAVSLSINYTNSSDFHAAGYEPIHTNASYIGGVVRQYGNLSFSRVFQAGHGAAGQQPETAYRIMERVLYNRDVSTGTVSTASTFGYDGSTYSSKGPSHSLGYRNEVIPVHVLQVCYLLDVNQTCTDDQIDMIKNGSAVIKDYMIVDKNSTARYPAIVGNGTVNGGGRLKREMEPYWRWGADLAFGSTHQDPQEFAIWTGL